MCLLTIEKLQGKGGQLQNNGTWTVDACFQLILYFLSPFFSLATIILQEPKTDKDEEYCRKVNELMNNPPTPGSSSRTPGSSSSNPAAALSSEITNLQDADIQNLFGNISQQQLMQILGSGMSSLATLLSPGLVAQFVLCLVGHIIISTVLCFMLFIGTRSFC